MEYRALPVVSHCGAMGALQANAAHNVPLHIFVQFSNVARAKKFASSALVRKYADACSMNAAYNDDALAELKWLPQKHWSRLRYAGFIIIVVVTVGVGAVVCKIHDYMLPDGCGDLRSFLGTVVPTDALAQLLNDANTHQGAFVMLLNPAVLGAPVAAAAAAVAAVAQPENPMPA
jgi:hypothetical protein